MTVTTLKKYRAKVILKNDIYYEAVEIEAASSKEAMRKLEAMDEHDLYEICSEPAWQKEGAEVAWIKQMEKDHE